MSDYQKPLPSHHCRSSLWNYLWKSQESSPESSKLNPLNWILSSDGSWLWSVFFSGHFAIEKLNFVVINADYFLWCDLMCTYLVIRKLFEIPNFPHFFRWGNEHDPIVNFRTKPIASALHSLPRTRFEWQETTGIDGKDWLRNCSAQWPKNLRR